MEETQKNILPVLQFGSPELREKANPVTEFDEKLRETVNVIKQTLAECDNAAALAANQVGILQRIVVIDYDDEYYELINPEITAESGTQEGSEGCLSLKGFVGEVSRFNEVTLKYRDASGGHHEISKEGFMARCIQHEVDHLDGILYIDRMTEPEIWNPDNGIAIDIEEIRALADRNKESGE